jgi:integrating conjugative element protein (TIGR03755 family)
MNNKIMLIAIAATIAVISPVSYAQAVKSWEKDVKTNNAPMYYKLGGSQAISRAPGNLSINAKLGLSGGLKLSYSCGRFTGSIAGLKATFQAKLEEYKQVATQALSSAVAALPMYIIARAAPDLYDNLQAIMAEASAELQAAFKTCEEMEREIADGKDPYESYARMARIENWKVETSSTNSGGKDVYSVKVAMRNQAGTKGVTWAGGERKGGVGQEPIKVVTDVTRAGYLSTIGQAPGPVFFRAGPATATAPNWQAIQRHFPTNVEAEQFATDVLGDIEVGTCEAAEGCPPKQTKPGLGLLPQIQREATLSKAQLADFVSAGASTTQFNAERLSQASAPGMAITRELIEAIRGMEAADAAMVVGRLAQEVAQVRIMDRALILRNIMMTGLQTPEIRGNAAAAADVREKLADLNQYIEDTLFEIRARKEVMTSTAETILSYHRSRQAASASIPMNGVMDRSPLTNGKVQK